MGSICEKQDPVDLKLTQSQREHAKELKLLLLGPGLFVLKREFESFTTDDILNKKKKGTVVSQHSLNNCVKYMEMVFNRKIWTVHYKMFIIVVLIK